MATEEGSTEGDEIHSDEVLDDSTTYQTKKDNPTEDVTHDRSLSSRNLIRPREVEEWEAAEVKEMESSMKQELRRLNHESVQFQGKAYGFDAHVMSGYLSRPENEEEQLTENEQTDADTTITEIRMSKKR
ncbi:hypothetical protein RFI_35855, partial [Reticulomyxa filosa]